MNNMINIDKYSELIFKVCDEKKIFNKNVSVS